MPIRKDKEEELKRRMERLGVNEADIEEKFILGSGRGGQKVNKTASCVYLKHTPTHIEVKCQKDRSREVNRFLARRMLLDKLEEQTQGILSKKQKMIEKIKKQKKRRQRRANRPKEGFKNGRLS